jgi:hypothetical protein
MVIGMLTKKDDSGGRKVYERFVHDGILKDMNITFWEDVKGQAVLGTDSFIDYIYERFLVDKNVDMQEQAVIEELTGGPATVEEIAGKVAEVFGVLDEKELYLKYSRNRHARSVFIELCRKHLGAKISKAELGRRLGNISRSAVNINKKRIEELIQKNKRVKGLYQKAEKKLKT